MDRLARPRARATARVARHEQAGGAGVIELGVPFTDPMADGATIQRTNEVALAHAPPVSLSDCIAFVKKARAAGLTVPVVLMGYYNPLLAYGVDKLMADCASAGVDGFIVVDLPPEEGSQFVVACRKHKLSFVPLVTPASTNERIAQLSTVADGFLYCVSLTGVTGARDSLPKELPEFIARVRANSNAPLAVGFGVSTREHVAQIASFADGVVVGSAVCKAVDGCKPGEIKGTISKFIASMVPTKDQQGKAKAALAKLGTSDEGDRATKKARIEQEPGKGSHFGQFGGRYIPETLVEAHRELEEAYDAAKKDPTFAAEMAEMRAKYIGGPTPMYHAKRLTEHCGGAQIWLKREELAHTGAHKINNAIGQALLAKRLGKKRIIAETGAGQHGVATATVCALFGLECVVYMVRAAAAAARAPRAQPGEPSAPPPLTPRAGAHPRAGRGGRAAPVAQRLPDEDARRHRAPGRLWRQDAQGRHQRVSARTAAARRARARARGTCPGWPHGAGTCAVAWRGARWRRARARAPQRARTRSASPPPRRGPRSPARRAPAGRCVTG